jgi:bifunctional non-homologous end joining protein LigD
MAGAHSGKPVAFSGRERMQNESQQLAFVVQKHRATRLHYDFRLEIDGVMPSWAIPRGPTLDNSAKRLAMPTGDHALDYRHFEGVLSAEGGYGAAPVMIWDEGTYIPSMESARGVWRNVTGRTEAQAVMRRGLQEGQLTFRLFGAKLHGSFALIRTRRPAEKESWLLIKQRDEYVQKGYDANAYDFSAVSKRSLAEIAASPC